jgi:serine/threonine protein kinase
VSGDDFTPIGTGPVATVYGGLYLALKVYPDVVDRSVLDAFERERAALEPLRGSASVLLVDDVLELPDGRTALQMELCAPSLADLVDGSGALLVEDAVDLGRTVASAVAAAHRAGVVHGGLSPHNVLFHPSGAVLVSDFGVALRRAFPAEHDRTAPETLLDGTLDERTDLYGLGLVLHLALTGRPPGEGDLPPRLERLVTRLLSEDPADRPSTADVVVRQLAAFREPPPVERPPTTAPDPAPPPRRRRLARTVAGIVAGGAALASTPYLVHADPPKAAPAATTTTTTTTTTTSARSIPLALAEPADHGTYVDLSWQAANGLTVAVLVTPEGGEPEVRVAQRNPKMRVEVEEGVPYCFRVQATDGALLVESPPRGVRGAVCKA